MRTELVSIPSTQRDRIEGFVAGAKAMLAEVPNASGNDPMCVDVEFRKSGNCHIYLLTGRWVGPHEADFSNCEPSNLWLALGTRRVGKGSQ